MRNQNGTTLFEMLAVLVPATMLALGATSFFSAQNRAHLQQDQLVAMENNLRAAMGIVSDTVRSAGCGTPDSNLDAWISWASGFTDRPIHLASNGTYGDTISIVACTPLPVARTTNFAAAGSTEISVDSEYSTLSVAALFNSSDKSLVLIGDTQHAVVTSVSGANLSIDTDPTTPGNQGPPRAFLAGTPITRIDVTVFTVASTTIDPLPGLLIDKYRGAPLRAAEGIVQLRLSSVAAGRHYRLAVTARAERRDPGTGQFPTRTLVSDIHLRN